MGTYIMNLIFHTGPTQYEEATVKGETEDLRYFLVQAILGNRSQAIWMLTISLVLVILFQVLFFLHRDTGRGISDSEQPNCGHLPSRDH
jgi:hypothetical protein